MTFQKILPGTPQKKEHSEVNTNVKSWTQNVTVISKDFTNE